MRQPVPLNRDNLDPQRRPRVDRDGRHGRKRANRPRRDVDRSLTGSPATRAILAIVVALVLGLLVYLISLSSRPSFSDLLPRPNSTTPAGPVKIHASVASSAKPIQRVVVTVDGDPVQPAVDVQSERAWEVNYSATFSQGKHDIAVQVIDTDGHAKQYQWSFTTAGPTFAPTMAFDGPPDGSSLTPGPVHISLTANTSGSLESAEIKINGQDIPTKVSAAAASNGDDSASVSGGQTWSVFAETTLAEGAYAAEATIKDAQGEVLTAPLHFSIVADPSKTTARYFADTNRYLTGPFKAFWESHGGDKVLGDPLSPQFVDQRGTTVQYFTYARLELLPGGSVGLGLIGEEVLPGPQERVDDPHNPAVLFFPETGHTLAGKFRDYWQQNGGVGIFGFPISEEIEEGGVRVQYFERGRLELRAGSDGGDLSVELTPVGEQLWTRDHPNQP